MGGRGGSGMLGGKASGRASENFRYVVFEATMCSLCRSLSSVLLSEDRRETNPLANLLRDVRLAPRSVIATGRTMFDDVAWRGGLVDKTESENVPLASELSSSIILSADCLEGPTSLIT